MQPVFPRHIKDQLQKGHCRDLNDAENEAGREAAAYDFLENELKFFTKIKIESTKWSPLKDILWITLAEPYMVKKIYKMAAETRNREARVLMYTPREYYSRITALEALCKVERAKDKELRTQIRIGEWDIELHIKKLGDSGWTKRSPLMFGSIPEPELEDKIRSPPKGRDVKRKDRDESNSPNGRNKQLALDEELGIDKTFFDAATRDIVI